MAQPPMHQAETTPPQDVIDVPQLARAIRFTLVTMVLGLSFLNIRSSLAIGNFQQIFADMLNGHPLPALTVFVITARHVFVAVSVLVPIAAIATLFLRGVVRSIYIVAVLGFIIIVQFITLWFGLSAPLANVIISMGGTAP